MAFSASSRIPFLVASVVDIDIPVSVNTRRKGSDATVA